MNSKYLTPKELSKYLEISTQTLAIWRTNKTYPLPYIKVGGRVRYKIEDVQNWLDSRQHNILQGVNNE